MKHALIIELANKLITPAHREAAKAELLSLVQDQALPEIEKVHIISIAEMHILHKAPTVSGFKNLLHFLCTLKQHIRTPHMVKFINEYMSLKNGKLKVSPYVERKLPQTDYYTDGTNALNLTHIRQKEAPAIRITT